MASARPPEPQGLGGTPPATRVLLVEDRPGDARLVQILLAESAPDAFAVTTAATFAAAVTRLQAEPPDAVLLDLGLPDLDGLRLVQQVRAAAGGTPIVVLTGRDDEELALETLRHGAQDYLLKADLRGDLLVRALRYAIERGQVEAALAQAKAAAEAAEQAKGRFLARVSHEIRTPLTTIMAMAHLLVEDGLAPLQQERCDAVAAAARSLLEVVNDILDVSKLESGRMTLSLVPFALRAVLDDGLRALAAWARSQSLEFSLVVGDDVPDDLVSDPVRLRQILTNLVSNAIKFTDRGSVRVQVELVDSDTETVLVRFLVRDTGQGIAASDQQTIFDAFAQADDSSRRRHGGTGLGLAICAELVALMQGQIGVDSEPGAGSTFKFTARLRRAAEPAPAWQAVDLPPLRLLLVDDMRVNRMATAELLRREGHSVVEAADGAQALAAIEQSTPDAVLMDVEMPVMDGREAVAEIRRRESTRGAAHLAIVGLSAYGTDEDRDACLAAGMDGYVAKPVSMQALQAALAKATGHGTPAANADGPPSAAQGDVDWRRALDLAGGDEGLLQDLARAFVEESRAVAEDLHRGLQQSTIDLVRRSTHALRGMLAQVGCDPIAAALVDISARAQNGEWDQARAAWSTAAKPLERVTVELVTFGSGEAGDG